MLAGILLSILVLTRKLIWRLIVTISRGVTRLLKTVSGLLRGNLTIKESHKSNSHDKFPAVESIHWHPQFSRIVRSVLERTSAIVSGPFGSGRTELGIAALKDIGYPENSEPSECSFILIDCAAKQSAEAVLDSILEANNVSVSTQEGVDRKLERIAVLSQSRYCSTLLGNLDYLLASDQNIILALPGRTSTKFRFVFTSQPSVRFDAPDIARISLHPLERSQIELICQASSSQSIRALSASDLDQVIEATKGAFVPITAAVRNSESREALFQLLSETGDEAGIVRTAILKPISHMNDIRRRALVFVARYGGKASWKLLSHVFNLEDQDIKEIKQQLALTPSVFFRGDSDAGTIEFSGYAADNISGEYNRKYSYGRSAAIANLVQFFSSFDEIKGLHTQYSEFYADRSILKPIFDDISESIEASLLFDLYQSFCELLYNRGYFEQRILLGLEVGKSLEKKGSPELASWVICSAGSVATVLGQTEIARTHIDRAKQLALRSSSTNDVLRAERALGSTFYRDGKSKFFEANRSVDFVLQHPDVKHDLTNLIDAIYLKICIRLREVTMPLTESDTLSVNDLVDQMKSACEQAGWQRGRAYASLEEARLSAALGNLDDAQRMADEALSIGEDYEDARHVARCQMFIGQVALAKSRRLLGKGFSTGLAKIRTAGSEFSRLKMDNELEEARALLAAGSAVRVGQRLPFQLWLSIYPIGGD